MCDAGLGPLGWPASRYLSTAIGRVVQDSAFVITNISMNSMFWVQQNTISGGNGIGGRRDLVRKASQAMNRKLKKRSRLPVPKTKIATTLRSLRSQIVERQHVPASQAKNHTSTIHAGHLIPTPKLVWCQSYNFILGNIRPLAHI